jgi:hypothetical protein
MRSLVWQAADVWSRSVLILALVISGGSLAACADDESASSNNVTNSVCFELGSDWGADGRFQQSFLGADREMLPGMTGFSLNLSPYFLQINLSAEVDPEVWLSQLPFEPQANPAVSSTYVGACRT